MDAVQARWMVVMSGLVLLLTALWTWWPQATEADDEATTPVWEPRTDGIASLEVVTPEGSVRLARADGVWRLVHPVSSRADADRVDATIADLGRIERGIPVASAQADGSPFGLADPPAYTVRLSYADGTVSSLEFGSEAPTGYRTYARGADRSVVAVAGRPTRQLAADADAWRDRRVVQFAPEQVRGIRMRGEQGVLEVHGEATRWWIEGAARANPDRVDDLVLGLLDIRLERFGEPVVDVAPREVAVALADGAVHTLRFGPVQSDGLVAVAGGQAEGWAHASELALLGTGPADVADRRAFGFDVEGADEVWLTVGDRSWHARRDNARWVDDAGADVTERIGELAGVTAEVSALSFVEPVWATVRVRAGATDIVVDVGGSTEAGTRTLRDASGGRPYGAPAAGVAMLADWVGATSAEPR